MICLRHCPVPILFLFRMSWYYLFVAWQPAAIWFASEERPHFRAELDYNIISFCSLYPGALKGPGNAAVRG